MKIYAPIDANGVYASVMFVNGVGESDDPYLLSWFANHGYTLGGEVPTMESEVTEVVSQTPNDEINFEEMTPIELREWMKINGLGKEMKNIRNKDKLLEIIKANRG